MEIIRFFVTFILVFTLGVIIIEEVRADSLYLGGVSHHFISDDTTESFHRAVLYEKGDFLGGYVYNSYGEDSFVGAYNIYNEVNKGHSVDVFLGAVRGYDKCYGKFEKGEKEKSKVLACPILVINATIHTDTYIKPVLSLWGDALVLTGRIDF